MALTNFEKFCYDFGTLAIAKLVFEMDKDSAKKEAEILVKKYDISKAQLMSMLEYQLEIIRNANDYES